MVEIVPRVPPKVKDIPGARLGMLVFKRICAPPTVKVVPVVNETGLANTSEPPTIEEITPVVPPPTMVIPADRFKVLLTVKELAFTAVAEALNVPNVTAVAPLLSPTIVGSVTE